MNSRTKKLLFDIKISIEEIETFLEGTENNFFMYKENLMLKKAVERNLEIIGEAVNRLSKIDDTVEITNAKGIIGLRNQIIHAYDNISDENIWSILINHLPKLKEEITSLLS